MGAKASTNLNKAAGAGKAGQGAAGPKKAGKSETAAPAADDTSAPSKDPVERAKVEKQLKELLDQHPFLEEGKAAQAHPLSRWVGLCRECIKEDRFEAAVEHLNRVQVGLRAEVRPIAEAFRRFDVDGSGQLDGTEFRHMCAYLGWGDEEADLMDLDGDGKVSLREFQAFVGAYGGIQQLFEQRRLRISTSRKDVCDFAGIAVGSRVKAHFYIRGQKSKSWREAVVLAVGVERSYGGQLGPATLGVKLEFGFGEGESSNWRAQQVVPPNWIVSGVEDAELASALREVGILDEQQAFWSLVLPETELQALELLEGCQRGAMSLVRSQATESHNSALDSLREHFTNIGFGEMEMQAVLDWVQDLAPIVVHVNLDGMGHFMEVDDYYRSQFETKTSNGAGDGDDNNRTRRSWEHELFGGLYDDAKPFERCKYGALNVMNDYRGVVTANQYGDSYMVLKDVRLRCTFASEDSGGIEGSRLAVLDKYAHVLDEYDDEELRGLVQIATSAISPDREALSAAAGTVTLIRGSSEDSTAEWITQGFPNLAQYAGRYYFEVTVFQDTGAPQVGLLSTSFEQMPHAYSQEGVGDDAHGWALDVLNAGLWHKGTLAAWGKARPAKERTVSVQGAYPWMKTQVQERVLAEDTVIGVAVDVDKGTIYFSCDGSWPAAPSMRIPAGTPVYPAVSLKGRASFNFGRNLKYSQPDHAGRFAKWPGTTQQVCRVDCPHLGDEATLSCYKEVQIHGQVNLARNVQRLVAASKYRDKPKTERSLALRVSGTNLCDGTYRRVGEHGGEPLYHGGAGGCLFFDKDASAWRLNDSESTESWRFTAAVKSLQDPPRKGWVVPDIDSGIIDAAAFSAEMKEAGIADEAVDKLVEALAAPVEDGKRMVFRKRGEASLAAEWEKLESPGIGAQEVWDEALERVRKQLQAQHGLSQGKVVESSHPYEAERHSWREEVSFEGAPSLKVYFASDSCTYDSKTTLRMYAGGLSRGAAGPGARVEVSAPGSGTVWGTVEKRTSRDAVWRVRLDRQPVGEAAEEEEETELDELGIHRWPQIGDEVEGKYVNGRWYGASVSDIVLEVDWYTATRTATYLLDWKDGDPKDREKAWEELRRPASVSSTALQGHHYLEELPVYGAISPAGEECYAICSDEPKHVAVKYGLSSADVEAFTFTDNEDDTSTLRFSDGEVEWDLEAAGYGSDTLSVITIDRPDSDKPCLFRVDGPFGSATLADPPEGPEQLKLVARLVMAAQKFDVEVECEFLEELRAEGRRLAAEPATGEDSKAGSDAKTLGSEISGFELNTASPLAPITVKEFSGDGPAQQHGVKPGWYLDLEATINKNDRVQDLLKSLAGRADVSSTKKLLEAALKTPKELLKVLNGPLLSCTEITLVFMDSCSKSQAKLLPEAHVHYGQGTRVSSEVKLFECASRQVKIETFLKQGGPAQKAGVRTDWVLDVHKTLHHNHGKTQQLTEEVIIENPNVLLAMTDVVLIFKQPNPSKTQKRMSHGPAGTAQWETCELPGDCADFAFATDGDGKDDHTKRWGVWALVLPQSASKPAQEKIDKLAKAWAEASRRATWVKEPEVQRDDWDEARLRALCARHGWEFEWMTEDGERRRRAKEVGRLAADSGLTEAAKAAVQKQQRSAAASEALPDGALREEATSATGEGTGQLKKGWTKIDEGETGKSAS